VAPVTGLPNGLYPQMAPYLSDVQDADYHGRDSTTTATGAPAAQGRTTAPGQNSHAVTPTSAPRAGPTAYLQNFLEYPGLCLVVWVPGKVGRRVTW
jgi:hypothetical protein